MRPDWQLLSDHGHRVIAYYQAIRHYLIIRVAEAKFDPNDWDLNPHLQIEHAVDFVVEDVKAEGFPECTRENVYLFWLTSKIFTRGGDPL